MSPSLTFVMSLKKLTTTSWLDSYLTKIYSSLGSSMLGSSIFGSSLIGLPHDTNPKANIAANNAFLFTITLPRLNDCIMENNILKRIYK